MNLTSLTAISPIDGRYLNKTSALMPHVSEFGLLKYRVEIEIRWFLVLSDDPEIIGKKLSQAEKNLLIHIYENFSEADAQTIKDIEKTTNHDIKAVEYFIKDKLTEGKLKEYKEFIHFACTSEDINNLAYGRMLQEVRNILLQSMHTILYTLKNYAKQWHDYAMLARTHGQAATPTTLGKEFANFYARLHKFYQQFEKTPICGKINGAIGNYNAHQAAYPNVNWPLFAKKFVESLGLEFNAYTTQIENHDYLVHYFHVLMQFNLILVDLCRDIWGYISLNYLTQKMQEHEVGSSTMPHKVNPIDFENAEGNLQLANGLMETLSRLLPVSRWQRDLVDSTLQRNIGSVFAYSLIAYEALLKGLGKITANKTFLAQELNAHWELLAEPIQTVMRKYNLENPYDQLKQFTRGKQLNLETVQDFIRSLNIPAHEKQRLMELTPASYLGYACELAKGI